MIKKMQRGVSLAWMWSAAIIFLLYADGAGSSTGYRTVTDPLQMVSDAVPPQSGDIERDGRHHFGFGRPGKLSEAKRTIRVVAGDTQFNPDLIVVGRGETILLEISNSGKLMHEFSMGTDDAHMEHRARYQAMVSLGLIEADRINHDLMELGGGPAERAAPHEDPGSVLLEPGDVDWIVWRFDEPATIRFACNLPGHYDAGMAGIIEVQ